jgi:site-specific recombinase XerD
MDQAPITQPASLPARIGPSANQHPDHTLLVPLIEQVQEFIEEGISQHTREAYERDWQQFVAWCEQYHLPSMPASPETIACYMTAMATTDHKYSTLSRYMAAISAIHQHAGHPSPTQHAAVRAVMRGIRRRIGVTARQVDALMTDDMRRIMAVLPETLKGRRDRALLLLGYAGAFRRSELVAFDVADLTFREEGVVICLRRSKTDQEGEGRWVAIPFGTHEETCPVRALKSWLESSGITGGALFRGINRHDKLCSERLSDRAVANLIKKMVKEIGLDPKRYSGHSLRAGHCTAAARAGANERSIMQQTGHRSNVMVQRYIRMGVLFQENSASLLDL